MARWNLDFLDLLTALNVAEAKYLLVGGHAVGLYGTPRATKDFDLWVEPSADNAARVVQALRAFGAPLAGIDESLFASAGSGFRMGTPPFRIELLTEVSGLAFGRASSRSRRRSAHPGDERLYISLAGPWLDLAARERCGDGRTSCAMETLNQVFLVVRGLAQSLGTAGMAASFFVREPPRAGGQRWQLAPLRIGQNGYGLAALGKF